MSLELNPGEVVRLKSGGPKMTVNEVHLLTALCYVECIWFVVDPKTKTYQVAKERFHTDTLEKVLDE